MYVVEFSQKDNEYDYTHRVRIKFVNFYEASQLVELCLRHGDKTMLVTVWKEEEKKEEE